MKLDSLACRSSAHCELPERPNRQRWKRGKRPPSCRVPPVNSVLLLGTPPSTHSYDADNSIAHEVPEDMTRQRIPKATPLMPNASSASDTDKAFSLLSRSITNDLPL
jgi:hypothetical protein